MFAELNAIVKQKGIALKDWRIHAGDPWLQAAKLSTRIQERNGEAVRLGRRNRSIKATDNHISR